MERHETPSNILQLLPLPSLRSEFIGILTIYLLRAMHMVRRKPNTEPFSDEKRRLTIRATASRDDSGFQGFADVVGDLRV